MTEIKAGQFYQTRGGQRAYISSVSPKGSWPVVGIVDGESVAFFWRKDGSFSVNEKTNPFDLVEPWGDK